MESFHAAGNELCLDAMQNIQIKGRNLITSLCLTQFLFSLCYYFPLGDMDLKRRDSVKRKIAEVLEHAERLLSIQTPTHNRNT